VKKLVLGVMLCASALFAAPMAVIETTQGAIEIELRPDVAPKACENFIALSKKGYYNGISFHRIIKGFMIQGGDPTGTGAGGNSIWGRPFNDEITPKLTFEKPLLLAMANRGPNTNGSQFFITVAPAPWLNGYHTIFGSVIKGADTVKKLELTPTGMNDKPRIEQKIIKITIKEK
jgi:peptidylprolyl isomerase